MGGPGSGRRPTYSGKGTAEGSMPLDIRRLAKAGALQAGTSSGWQWSTGGRVHSSIRIWAEVGGVTLSYTYRPHSATPEVVSQPIRIVTTPGTLGGQRPWFACPACGKRVAVIYGAGRHFACRKCKGLAYESQTEREDDRAARKADRIRKRLGWPAGILNPSGGKPKGMHWRTFSRLSAEHDDLVLQAMEGMARQLGLLRRSLATVNRELAKTR